MSPIGEEKSADVATAAQLVRPEAVARFVTFWIIGPSVSAGLAFGYFALIPP
ncbi:MAG: phosphate transporter [Natrialbaceae archaeon]|nr:phosphate transporter [Natrialbaceae archaeon]